MNSSEATTEWSSLPNVYEVELQKLTDINLNSIGNETALNNDTFTFQGERKFIFISFKQLKMTKLYT